MDVQRLKLISRLIAARAESQIVERGGPPSALRAETSKLAKGTNTRVTVTLT
jgi:hypothetical protein